ncbi:MAG: TlpA family protein disulfide reductase [Candidatus Omnitrophica bacterium]|nr:TlpA family protein disulfide reductase [Candidatus Omnitrophota bacterium]
MKIYLMKYLLVLFFFLSILRIDNVYLFASEKKAIDFKLIDIDDQWVDLASYKGKSAVLLLFWATWCPYCRRELRVLKEKYDSIKDSLELLVIDIEESKERIRDFLKKNNLGSLRVLLDRDGSVAYAYRILGVPTYVLIDKEGNIVFMGYHFPHDYKELILR